MPCFFYNRIRKKKSFTLPFVNDNEIVGSTSDEVEGKSSLICLVRYIRSCWCRRVLQFLVTLDNGKKQSGFGWPPKTMWNLSIAQPDCFYDIGQSTTHVHAWQKLKESFFKNLLSEMKCCMCWRAVDTTERGTYFKFWNYWNCSILFYFKFYFKFLCSTASSKWTKELHSILLIRAWDLCTLSLLITLVLMEEPLPSHQRAE